MPHIHEKIDFAADVYIVYKDKVFLRVHDKLGIWLAVGGHIELDEDPNTAAVREAKEESGLDVELVPERPLLPDALGKFEHHELIPPRFLNSHLVKDGHKHISMIYFGRSQTDQINPTGDDKSDEWHWFSKEELEANKQGILEPILSYAKSALEELGTNT